MAPPACERGSQGVEKSTPGGLKNEAPGDKFRPLGLKFRPPGGFRSPLGRLGRQVGLRRALWAEQGGLENCMERSWDPSLGPLGVSWARFGSIPPPSPRGGANLLLSLARHMPL